MKWAFESTLEKIGRILAAQYGLTVVFEGETAFTDGKTVTLPYIHAMSEEMMQDMNGFLDHEVGHCKFSDFGEIKEVKTRFHKELLNAVEDTRIEREMIKEFPGTVYHLKPLNDKYRGKMMEKWSEMPWPVRTIVAIRDLMEGRTPVIDEDIERYVDVVKEAAVALNDCKSTKELRIATKAIIDKIIEEREEEKKEESGGDEDGKKSDKKDSKGSKSSGKGKSGKEKADGEGKAKSKPESGESKAPGSGDEDSGESEDKMLTAKDDKRFDEHVHDVHGMMDKEIKKALKDAPKTPRSRWDPLKPEWKDVPSIPTTTRFDRVIDHVGKGNPERFAKLKREVMPAVQPIKQQLERVLKVRENAKWTPEKERGSLNARSLAQMASNKSYRTVFKEYTKTETKNVAVEILVDLSGSMSGRVDVAKRTVIAMSEALKDLDIPFEVTGFNSVNDVNVASYSASLPRESVARFNRTAEALELFVFKSFDSPNLLGIEKMKAGVQNPDGECVVWAAKRLMMRKEKRKILMVLSDGQPCTGDGQHAILCSDLKNRVRQMSKTGIECIGVGIQTDCVKDFYPDYIVVNSIDELAKQSVRKLSKLIQGGGE
jgi:cobalamin biosynthesis protein CobT